MHGAAQRKALNTDGSPVISKCELKGSINTKKPTAAPSHLKLQVLDNMPAGFMI